MTKYTNLFGDPSDPPQDPRGRPVHQVTLEKQRRVAVLRTLGFSEELVAEEMGLSKPTLRKHYLHELHHGAVQARANLAVRLYEKADEGKVPAIKEFFRMVEKADLIPALRAHRATPPRIGKKEQAALDAARSETTTTMGELMSQRMTSEIVH